MTDRQNGMLEWICFKCLSTSWESCDLNITQFKNAVEKYVALI